MAIKDRAVIKSDFGRSNLDPLLNLPTRLSLSEESAVVLRLSLLSRSTHRRYQWEAHCTCTTELLVAECSRQGDLVV